LDDVRTWLTDHPSEWRELDAVIAGAAAGPLPPLMALPLAAAAAVGGEPADAVPCAAAWLVVNLAMRVFDDLHDRDRYGALHERVGDARASNLAAGMLVHSQRLLDAGSWSDSTHRRVTRVFLQEAERVAAGQDVDLAASNPTLAQCWTAIVGKSGRAFALACGGGAAAGGGGEAAIEACLAFGHHLGLVVALFDDLQGIWDRDSAGDLERGKHTLPLLFALEAGTAGSDRLRAIAAAGEVAQRATEVRELLDVAGVRTAMVCAALEEREAALAALAPCRNIGDIAPLTAYETAMFADAAEIAGLDA
jgi:geranylgeranyl pyrophosphate synthase